MNLAQSTSVIALLLTAATAFGAPVAERPNMSALYNLKSDIGEKHNLAVQHPEIIEEMKTRMNRSRTEPRDSQRRAR